MKCRFSRELDVRITDTSLRDGSHRKRDQFEVDDVIAIVSALDDAGVRLIEVAHGDGMGGSSFKIRILKVSNRTLISAAVQTAARRALPRSCCPAWHQRRYPSCADLGATVIRIATHCTEAMFGAAFRTCTSKWA